MADATAPAKPSTLAVTNQALSVSSPRTVPQPDAAVAPVSKPEAREPKEEEQKKPIPRPENTFELELNREGKILRNSVSTNDFFQNSLFAPQAKLALGQNSLRSKHRDLSASGSLRQKGTQLRSKVKTSFESRRSGDSEDKAGGHGLAEGMYADIDYAEQEQEDNFYEIAFQTPRILGAEDQKEEAKTREQTAAERASEQWFTIILAKIDMDQLIQRGQAQEVFSKCQIFGQEAVSEVTQTIDNGLQ